MLLRIPFEHRNAQSFQIGGHGGIDVFVGAGDLVAPLLEHAGQRGHGGSGDPDQVDTFDAGEFFDVGHRSKLSKKRAVAGIPRPGGGVRTYASHLILIQNQSYNTGGSFMSSKRTFVVMMAVLALTASGVFAQNSAKKATAPAAAKATDAAKTADAAADTEKAPRLTVIEPVKDYGTV